MDKRRLLLILIIFAFWYAYVSYGLLSPLDLAGPWRPAAYIMMLVPFATIWWLPLYYWRLDDPGDSFRVRAGVWASYSSIALLSLTFFFLLARDVLAPFFPTMTPLGSAVVVCAAIVAFLAGLLNAFLGLTVKQVQVPLENLPSQFEGFKIAQISDLHIGPTIRKRFLNRLVEKLNATQPDIVVITGDLVDGTVAQLKEHVAILSDIKARVGRFYVTGNHEYYWEAGPWIEKMRELGFTPLINENQTIERNGAKIAIAGAADIWSGDYNPKKAREGIADGTTKILLSHQPNTVKDAAKLGFDLQLSGHTHGGQFIPWTWIIRLFQKYPRGLHKVENTWLYVNQGAGHWGPPIRLGAAPEITLLQLTSH